MNVLFATVKKEGKIIKRNQLTFRVYPKCNHTIRCHQRQRAKANSIRSDNYVLALKMSRKEAGALEWNIINLRGVFGHL